MMSRAPAIHKVAIVAFDGLQLLDLAGPTGSAAHRHPSRGNAPVSDRDRAPGRPAGPPESGVSVAAGRASAALAER